jgi:hypothetical protein
MRNKAKFAMLTGWMLPFVALAVLLSRWMIDILIPTLKGGNFDALYDRHNFRYLDTAALCAAIGFVWFAGVVLWWTKKYMSVNAVRGPEAA